MSDLYKMPDDMIFESVETVKDESFMRGDNDYVNDAGDEEEKLLLIITEEKGMFKPDDTFWIDKFLVEAIGVNNPKNFSIKLTSSTGNTKVVKTKAQSGMGANISATYRCLKSYGFNVGEMVSVEPMD